MLGPGMPIPIGMLTGDMLDIIPIPIRSEVIALLIVKAPSECLCFRTTFFQ